MSHETATTDVLREVLIMKMLNHPNIVNLIEVIDDPNADHFYMVIEYVEGKWVFEGAGPQVTWDKMFQGDILGNIVSGLMYLHAHLIKQEVQPFDGLTYHGKDADTWAVGVTLYCMILGQYPFLGDTLQDTYDKIVNDPLRLPKGMGLLLKNLLKGLLAKVSKFSCVCVTYYMNDEVLKMMRTLECNKEGFGCHNAIAF
ncbi:serine/threonine-protein kinase GRIK2-like protein [Tanacetum coccineum]